jgi:hypothetical protein
LLIAAALAVYYDAHMTRPPPPVISTAVLKVPSSVNQIPRRWFS